MDESFAAPQSDSSLERAVEYCASQVRTFDRDRYLTVIATSKEFRSALFVLYAFNLEISKTRETVSEPMLGRIRLQWWREAIEGIYHGTPCNHEVVIALASIVKDHSLSRELFDGLIDGREFDLEEREPRNIQELEAYVRSTSGNLLRLVAEITGADDEAANRLGIAWALVGLMKSIGIHRAQQRSYLPAIPVGKIGTEEASQAFQDVLNHSRSFLNPVLSQGNKALTLHHWIARYDLKQLEKKGFSSVTTGTEISSWRHCRIVLAGLLGH